MFLESLISGLILFGSISSRTSNVQPNPNDYEVSIGLKSKLLYINRQWERELGSYYVDDELWLEYSPSFVYIKPMYINKISKDLNYIKLDVRYKYNWLSIGYTGLYMNNEVETLASIGIHFEHNINKTISIVNKFDSYFNHKRSIDEGKFNTDLVHSIKWKLNDKVNLFNNIDYHKILEKTYYSFKVGLEFIL